MKKDLIYFDNFEIIQDKYFTSKVLLISLKIKFQHKQVQIFISHFEL